MKAKITRFKSLSAALKELEPRFRDRQTILSGKPFKKMDGMRPREAIANWLLCAAVNHGHKPERLQFSSDPTGGDGLIIDTDTEEVWTTEHVIALSKRAEARSGDDIILDAIKSKVLKGGSAYAVGKTLVVFAEGVGVWNPTSITKQLPAPLHFDAVWVVALQDVMDGSYSYNVTRLDLRKGHPPVWKISIAADFESWNVEG